MILCLLSVSCGTVPDVIICAEVNISKGLCTFTVSGRNIVVDDDHPYENQTWFDIRAKTLSVPASSWAQIKAWMIKQCKKTKKCEVDIDSWDRELTTK